MRLAVLSDIHGNYIALDACIKYSLEQGVHAFVFLGDYVGELAFPQKTMEMLNALRESHLCYFVKGNKEDYWLNYEKDGETGWKENDSTTGSLFYTYHNLTKENMSFFRSLSHKEELGECNWPAIPEKYWEMAVKEMLI